MVNALCSQLMYMNRKPVDGGWEQHLGYDPVVSPIQVARTHFLTSLISDLQERFARGVWVQQEGLLDWIEASSCSCQRVFPFVTFHDHGQSTQLMCEVLWIRCNRYNGPCVEEWCPGEVFAELRGTQFRPRRRVRRHTVDVEDSTLLCFEAFKDFSVPCDVEDFEPTEEMMSFWARPTSART